MQQKENMTKDVQPEICETCGHTMHLGKTQHLCIRPHEWSKKDKKLIAEAKKRGDLSINIGNTMVLL